MAEARGRRLGAQMENVAGNNYSSVVPMFVMKISSRDDVGNIDSDLIHDHFAPSDRRSERNPELT